MYLKGYNFLVSDDAVIVFTKGATIDIDIAGGTGTPQEGLGGTEV